MRVARTLLAAAIAAAAFAGPAHAFVQCVPITPLQGGACVEVNAPGGTGPTLRVSCGGTFWDCRTIVIP